ncbi:VanZ family protein [Piscinibacter sp. Jin2]|uniref:VanZ family protein n=1 Tax=Aquariibacter lacus TaxID=2801332 RepID=A0A9X1BPW7_9BURK|nr:VanZ family protein [Piscinibacter lacus]MBL0718936.1 VanZ family protein [Piscinibacter lacus]
MAAERSSAWTLAAVCAGLIVYASLHPFIDWTAPRDGWLSLGLLPWPHYQTRFDTLVNVLGYAPFGAFLTTAQLRGGRGRLAALLGATLAGALLSQGLESVQHLLPVRVPSRLDWLCNTLGAALGAAFVLLLHAAGALARWSTVRRQCFLPGADFGLALLWLWPLGLLYPPALPFAPGQVLPRLRELAEGALAGTPWADTLQAGQGALPALGPLGSVITVSLGALAPCLVASAITAPGPRRAGLLVGALLLAVGTSTLSTALNFGPEHALAWWTPPVAPALALAALLALLLVPLPARRVAQLGLPLLAAGLLLANLAPEDPYVEASLQGWEQGRFIRFHGISQWVGWLWPAAALLGLLRLATTPAGRR